MEAINSVRAYNIKTVGKASMACINYHGAVLKSSPDRDHVSFGSSNGKKKNYLPIVMTGLPILGFAMAFGPFHGPLARPERTY